MKRAKVNKEKRIDIKQASDISSVLCRLFFAMFGILFTWVMIYVVFDNPYHETAYLLPVSFLCLLALCIVYKALQRYDAIPKKRYRLVLTVFCGAMFIVQLMINRSLEFDPAFDMGAVYHGAVEWAETGTFKSYYDYFEMFPNNIGAMLFLYLIFKFFLVFGAENLFAVAAAINSIMAVGTIAVVSLICRREGGTAKGLFALVIFAFSLPFYIIGDVFYTDAMSMLFPVLTYYLYLRARDEREMKRQILFYALMAFAAAAGMQIKFTSVTALIAVAIDMCLRFEKKRAVTAVACTAAVMLIVSVSVNGVVYSHLDRETVKNRSLVYNHHIMMGLNGDGSYSPSDYEFSKSFDNAEERNAAIGERIKERLDNLGYKGLYDLFSAKAAKDFGDGTYGFSDFLDDSPVKDSGIHKYVLYAGESYSKYSHLCTGMHIAVMLLMLFGACGKIFSEKKELRGNIIPYLAVFGVFAVLMIWETNRRYFFNFVPMIFICAAMGAEGFISAISALKEKAVQCLH